MTRARLAVLALAATAACGSASSTPPVAAQGAATPAPAPSALDALEQRLIQAPSFRIHAHLASGGRIESHFEGTVSAGTGSRMRFALQGAFGGKDADALFTCDGARMRGGHRGQPFDLDAAPALREGFVVDFVRRGLLHNVARLAMGRTPDNIDGSATRHLEVVGATHSPGEMVRGAPTDMWSWTLFVDHQKAADETLWLDAKSGLPVRRRVVVHFPEGDMQVGEEYDAFDVGGMLPEETFRIEP